MVTKSKSFNAVSCVPQWRLSINGLFATPGRTGLLIFQVLPPWRVPLGATVNTQPCEKIAGVFKLSTST